MTPAGGRHVGEGRTVVLVGLGNIGSALIDLIGRMPVISRAVLIDRDVYEAKNIPSQKIGRGDVGRSKARVQARYLRRINPDLEVVPVVDDLIHVPMALYNADLILSGLDSIAARIQLNEIAWRLGVPWLDGGVEPDRMLVRVTGFRPVSRGPCYECGLVEADYLNLGTIHACSGPGPMPIATNGSASLGAVAAGLLAIETERVLGGHDSADGFGRQIVFGPVHHRHFFSEIRRNPDCRFDHAVWPTARSVRLLRGASLGDLFAAIRRLNPSSSDLALEIAHHPLVNVAGCPDCGRSIRRPHLAGRLTPACPACRSRDLRPLGFETMDRIDEALPPATLRRSLRSLGLRLGDVLRVHSTDSDVAVVIAGDRL